MKTKCEIVKKLKIAKNWPNHVENVFFGILFSFVFKKYKG